MSIARQALELFDTDATLHEIETFLWCHNVGLHICADDLRERILRRYGYYERGEVGFCWSYSIPAR